MLRVSPSPIVFDRARLFVTFPGPAMKLRGALPNVPHGNCALVAGTENAAGLNHCFRLPPPWVTDAPDKFALNVPAVPHPTLSTSAAYEGESGSPEAKV